MGGERVQHAVVADARLQRAEPYPVACTFGGERGEDVGQSVAGIAVQGEVAACHDQFPIACGQEGAGAVENLAEGD